MRDTAEAATRHAILELVERDQVAIWWYNRLRPTRLAPDFAQAALPAGMAAWMAQRRRRTHHLLLPTDLPVATIVALSALPDGGRPAIGAAAALDPRDAVRAATLELLQGEITLAQMRAFSQMPDPPPPPPLFAWSQSTNLAALPELGAGAPFSDPPPPIDFAHLLDHFAAHDIDIVTVDITRPEFGIPVVKALSPQLRDWLPRFGPGRLYDVPVVLGLRDAPLAETALNPTPFVI
ncbi:MAG: hypothetical protein AcusKO_46160 [Acuticoccus sp.]